MLIDVDMNQQRRPSKLELVHAIAFGVGLASFVLGTLSPRSLWYLVAGPSLILSGALVLLGVQLTFQGTLGTTLRALLGTSQLVRFRLRAWLWIVAGIWIGVLGLERLRAERQEKVWVGDPVVRVRDCSLDIVRHQAGVAARAGR